MSVNPSSGIPASSKNTTTPPTLSADAGERDEWLTQKTKARPTQRRAELEGEEGEGKNFIERKKAPSAGIEKQKLVDPGYLYIKIKMLDADQILKWFMDLQKAASKRHQEVYGEVDNSYEAAEVQINVIKSIREDIGQYGHAHCHITKDAGHKMYNVLLGVGPYADFPRDKKKENPDGTVTIERENFITPYAYVMRPAQVELWMTDQENKFKKGEIEEEAYNALKESYSIYQLLRQWKKADDETKATDGELLNNMVAAIARVRSTLLLNQGASPEEADAAAEQYVEEVNKAIEGDTHVALIAKDVDSLKSWAAYACEVKIEVEKLYVTNAAKGTDPGHLYIINDIPMAVTETTLRSMFTRYNTQEGGEYARSYSGASGPGTIKIRDAYPHVWIQTEPKTGRRTANIAFSDSGVNDAEYAYHLMHKFLYPIVDAKGNTVNLELVLEWWDDNRKRGKPDRGGRSSGAPRRDYRTPMGGDDSRRIRTPQISTLPKSVLSVTSVPRPAGLISLPALPVSTRAVAAVAEGKTASDEPTTSSWKTPLSIQKLLEDEEGNIIEPVMHIVTEVQNGPARGYEANRRDDGDMPW